MRFLIFLTVLISTGTGFVKACSGDFCPNSLTGNVLIESGFANIYALFIFLVVAIVLLFYSFFIKKKTKKKK